ncbi:DUF4124 domain-containing protein [bacterium]|nr:DUF4124 domain-containing protein [bacterium]
MLKKVIIATISLLITAFLVNLIAFADSDVYTWRDKDGKIHVTEAPPPEGAELIKAIIHPTPTPTTTPGGYQGYLKSTQANEEAEADQGDTDEDDASQDNPDRIEGTPTPYVDSDGHDESWWRDKKRALESTIENGENRLQEISKELRRVNNDEDLKSQEKRSERTRLLQEKDTITENIANAKQELEDLDYEVKRAGGLPGWVRD